MKGYRFDRMEIAGSLGDLGTLLPLAMGLVMVNGLNPMGIFLSVGALYIFGGLYYGVPIAVQPMKVVAAYGVAMAISPEQITAAGLIIAGFMLFLGVTGLVDAVSKIVAKPVIRGVQLSTGIVLMSKGVQFIAGTSGFQTAQGLSEPFLSIQAIGPIPLGAILGTLCGLLALFFMDSKRYPAGILVVISGLVIGLALGGWAAMSKVTPGLYLPELMPFQPTMTDFTVALLVLALPQLPMTLGNAVIANRDLSFEYFGKESRKVTDRALCVSIGLACMVASAIGGMPLCHGAGGLAAHYRFGARTGGSNLIIGGIFVLLALLFGNNMLPVLQLMPMAVLGVLLIFSGVQLAMTIQDLRERKELFVCMVMVGLALGLNLAVAFGVGIALNWVVSRRRMGV